MALLALPWGCLRFVIVVFPDHTHLLIFSLLLSSLPGGKPRNVIRFFKALSCEHVIKDTHLSPSILHLCHTLEHNLSLQRNTKNQSIVQIPQH